VPSGATQAFLVNLTVATAAPLGRYSVAIELVSLDGNRTALLLPTQVGALGSGDVGGQVTMLVQPGEDAQVLVPVVNLGNAPLRVVAQAADSEPWRILPGPGEQVLPPGAHGTVALAWHVPADAADGAAVHRAQLLLTSLDGSFPASQQPVSALLSVGRSDLTVTAARAFQGAAGTVVQAMLRNAGNRDAVELQILLRAGGRDVDNVTVGRLSAGGTSNVTLFAPVGDTLVVTADPHNRIVERDETNNSLAVVAASTHLTPSPGGLLLLALLIAEAARRRPRTG
jgi:hypothetical protein